MNNKVFDLSYLCHYQLNRLETDVIVSRVRERVWNIFKLEIELFSDRGKVYNWYELLKSIQEI